MSLIERIESGQLPAELIEALRTLLSQQDVPYLDVPGVDGPGICVGTSLADIRRYLKAELEKELGSRPTVPANYSINGRRKLPDQMPQTEDTPAVGTTGQAGPGTATTTATTKHRREPPTVAQIESAPEAGTYRRKGKGRPLVSRAICSSSSASSDADQPHARTPPRSHRPLSQG